MSSQHPKQKVHITEKKGLFQIAILHIVFHTRRILTKFRRRTSGFGVPAPGYKVVFKFCHSLKNHSYKGPVPPFSTRRERIEKKQAQKMKNSFRKKD